MFNTICYDFHARLKEAGRVFYCIQFEGVALSQGCSADPRKLKREKVQNPTSAKIATLENFQLYGILFMHMCYCNRTQLRFCTIFW